MSVVEDTRKVLQDCLAPELRAIEIRLGALEERFTQTEQRLDKLSERTDRRFDDVAKRFDDVAKRFDDLEQRSERRHATAMDAVEATRQRSDRQHEEVMSTLRQMMDWASVQQRLARLEARETATQPNPALVVHHPAA